MIPITVTFSENVTVTGTPTLALNTAPAQSASYASGTGTSALVFNYTVQAGDTQAVALDYVNTGSLALAGSTIKDTATNAATLTLAPSTAAARSEHQDTQDRHHRTDRQVRSPRRPRTAPTRPAP